jgi:hypothetical protein
MMEAVRSSETSVDNHFTRQYIPEDNSEQHLQILLANTLQTSFVRVSKQSANIVFLFLVGTGRQDTVFATVDVFINIVSLELPPRKVLRCGQVRIYYNQSFVAPIPVAARSKA